MENNSKRKVVVTGGAGFIGSHVADLLVERGFDVHIVDNLYSGKEENINPEATFHKINILDLENLKSVMMGSEFIFHLAAIPSVAYSVDDPVETNKINIEGTLNVLISAVETKDTLKKLVYSASNAAYGDDNVLPIKEDGKIAPKNPYGIQKYVGELYCKTFSEIHGLPTVCLRYFNVFGKRQSPEGPYANVLGRFYMQKKNNEPLTIVGDGKQTRDFVYVGDVARANVLAAENDRVFMGESINIGTGIETSVLEIAELVGGEKVFVSPRPEMKRSKADIALAKDLMKWEPHVSIKEGLQEVREYINNF